LVTTDFLFFVAWPLVAVVGLSSLAAIAALMADFIGCEILVSTAAATEVIGRCF
jgi:hypothetical protein